MFFLWEVNFKVVAVVAILIGLSACASNQMNAVSDNAKVMRPALGKALVIFVRPSMLGGAVQSTIYDGDNYIGTLSMHTQIAYQATPGTHMFMVVGESADFMRAELLPNKTYYAEVILRPGVWKARFSFRPQNGQIPKKDVEDWLGSNRQVEVNDAGRKWAQEHAADIQAKKAKYLAKWQSKPEADKQTLNANSGI